MLTNQRNEEGRTSPRVPEDTGRKDLPELGRYLEKEVMMRQLGDLKKITTWTTGRYILDEITATPGTGLAIAKINGFQVYICNAPPRSTSVEYGRILHELVLDAST